MEIVITSKIVFRSNIEVTSFAGSPDWHVGGVGMVFESLVLLIWIRSPSLFVICSEFVVSSSSILCQFFFNSLIILEICVTISFHDRLPRVPGVHLDFSKFWGWGWGELIN